MIVPQVKFVGKVSVSMTAPANPFNPVIVIVDVAELLTVTAAGEVAVIVKSTKLNIAVAVWTSEPLVPVTVST